MPRTSSPSRTPRSAAPSRRSSPTRAGELCECTGSNIFVVRDGVILTPPLDSGCLAGITREVTIEWCREDGHARCARRPCRSTCCGTADEVFITSSTKDVLAIHGVDDRTLEPGPVTARAAEVFAACAPRRMDP